MKQRIAAITFVLCLLATAAFGAGVEMATWKLNESKSKFSAGTSKSLKVAYKQAGDQVKITVWSVDAKGKKSKNEWTGKFDGKDYAVTGDPSVDTRSLKKVNDRTFILGSKKGGKTMSSGKIVYAADGKSRVVTVKGKGPDGKAFSSSSFYDRD